jgi:hypothetical protein
MHRDRVISLHNRLYIVQVSNKPYPHTNSPRWSYFTLQTSNKPCSHTGCNEIEKIHCKVYCNLYRRATTHVLTRVPQKLSYFTAQFTDQTSSTPCPHTSCTEMELFHCTDEKPSMSSNELHRDGAISLYRRATRQHLTGVAPGWSYFTLQTGNTYVLTRVLRRWSYFTVHMRNTAYLHTSCTEIDLFHCTDEEQTMSSHKLHRDGANSMHLTQYNIQASNTSCPHKNSPRWSYFSVQTGKKLCPHTGCTEVEQLHFTVTFRMYRRAAHRIFTRSAQRESYFTVQKRNTPCPHTS